MVNVFTAFRQIQKKSVLVLGDLMLDTYTIGTASRISPEAPVPVLRVHHEEHRAGGAGNVVLNLLSMGASVSVIGRIGADKHGQQLIDALSSEGAATHGIVTQNDFPTPVKNRIIAHNQQMVRVDHETLLPLHEQIEQQVIDSLPELLDQIKVVAVSDYGKGFVTKTLMQALTKHCRDRSIPIIVDPKGLDYSKYVHATIVKPNLSEVYAAANLPLDAPLEMAAEKVLEATQAQTLMVTRSEEGISLFSKEAEHAHFPVRMREVTDVTGAGDTVLAMLTTALANGLSIQDATQLSNIAAGIAISRFGCARVTLSDLARRLLSDDVENKVFDEEHLFALQEALKDREFAILSLSSKKGLTPSVFESIRTLSERKNWDLLVYVEDVDPDPVFLEVIAPLHAVDYIIVDSYSLEHASKLLKPSEICHI